MSVQTVTQISYNNNEPRLISVDSNIPQGSWSYIPSIGIGQIAGILTAGADRVRGVFFNAAPKEETMQGMSRCGLRIAPKNEDLCTICRDEPFTDEDFEENTTNLENQAVTCATGTHAGFHWKCVREWLAENNHCFIDNAPFFKEGDANPAFSWRRVLAPIVKSAGIAAGMTLSAGSIAVAVERILQYADLSSCEDQVYPIHVALLGACWSAVEHFAGNPMSSIFSYKFTQLSILKDTITGLGKMMEKGIPQLEASHIALITFPIAARVQTLWNKVFDDLQLPEIHRGDIIRGIFWGATLPYWITLLVSGYGEAEISPETYLCFATILSGMITMASALRKHFANE